jgi:3-oxoacyl-[acyl-carrier protein] reductase
MPGTRMWPLSVASLPSVFSAEERARRSSKIPLGRYGRPEEFAAAVAFLGSERAAYIAGVALAGGLVSSMF